MTDIVNPSVVANERGRFAERPTSPGGGLCTWPARVQLEASTSVAEKKLRR
jgi:hypothetical protein